MKIDSQHQITKHKKHLIHLAQIGKSSWQFWVTNQYGIQINIEAFGFATAMEAEAKAKSVIEELNLVD